MIAVADVLQQDRLAGARRGDDQRPLALAERREQIHHAGRDRRLARFELEPLFGIDRRQLVERFDLDVVVGRHAVDVEDFLEARALAAAMALDHAGDQHAFAEAELLDHRAGHERIGSLAGEVGRRGCGGSRSRWGAFRARRSRRPAAASSPFSCGSNSGPRSWRSLLLAVGSTASAAAVHHRRRRVGLDRGRGCTTAATAAAALAVVVVAVASTATASTTAAPSFSFGHVTQSLNLNPQRSIENSAARSVKKKSECVRSKYGICRKNAHSVKRDQAIERSG